MLTPPDDLTTAVDTASITAACPRPGLAVVTVSGQIDIAAVQAMRAVLADLAQCAHVVVDAGAVSFIDRAGLHPLVEAARAAAAAGGRLVVRDPPRSLVCLITWCDLAAELPVQAAPTRHRGRGRRGQGAVAGQVGR